jgi:hypothetical protein
MDALDLIGVRHVLIDGVRGVQLGDLILTGVNGETVLLKVVEADGDNGCSRCYYRNSFECLALACGTSFEFVKIG